VLLDFNRFRFAVMAMGPCFKYENILPALGEVRTHYFRCARPAKWCSPRCTDPLS
jgi:hypothetical protein